MYPCAMGSSVGLRSDGSVLDLGTMRTATEHRGLGDSRVRSRGAASALVSRCEYPLKCGEVLLNLKCAIKFDASRRSPVLKRYDSMY